MSRVTVAGLQEELSSLHIAYDLLHEQHIKIQDIADNRSRKHMKDMTGKNAEIIQLRKHIGFVHAQRNRLIGFLEGRESITNPEVELETPVYNQPRNTRVNRLERFMGECTQQFIRDDGNGVQVRNDELRYQC